MDRLVAGRPVTEEQATDTSALVDEAINDFELVIRPDKKVGAGRECVYLYFNPNDRRLVELEGRDVWECKIGRTGSRDAIQRILGQGISLEQPSRVCQWSGSFFLLRIPRLLRAHCIRRLG
jgi:hypothetical protein